jgi:RNA polymerase sigma factor (sigma-70 family)
MAKPRRANYAHSSNGFYSPRQLADRSEERQALLDEALAGSADAHAELLVNCYGAKMFRYFGQRLSNAHRRKADEDDLAQIARMHALEKFTGFIGRTPQSYWAWLRKICDSLIQRLVRFFSQAKRDLSREELLDELRLEDGEQHAYGRRQKAADEIFEALETSGQLQLALAQLPDDWRQIVVWRVADRLAFAEVARRLKRSNDFIERTFRSAIQRLKQGFGD